MVSFSCEACNETMIKKKVQPHLNQCRAPVTCIDCSKTFPGQSFKDHNQCISEAQKYQGKLYKPKEKIQPQNQAKEKPAKQIQKHEGKSKREPTPIKVTKDQTLKKLFKSLRKEHKIDKKHLLDRIVVTSDGKLILQ